MLATIQTRIDNLMKALQQVVLPALPADAALAREQAQLVIGHLSVIAQQWPRAAAYEAGNLEGLKALGEALIDAAEGGPETQRWVAELKPKLTAATDPADVVALQADIVALGHCVDRLIEAAGIDGSAAFHAASTSAVLAHAERQALRERIWCAGTRLDPDVASLPPFESLFSR
jgi:hypothetical protein